jgi:single-strand DNA-binding protein
MNVNRVTLAGRLVRDPDIKYASSGTAIADLNIAVTHFYKGPDGQWKEESDFIDVVAYGKTADNVAKFLHKGSEIYIEGRLKLDRWEDKTSGNPRSKLRVIADSMQFVGPKPAGRPLPSEPPQPSKELQEQRARNAAATGREAPSDPDADDIPF